ncbi:MAG: TonB-dependent receptor [Rhodanobacter sp.]
MTTLRFHLPCRKARAVWLACALLLVATVAQAEPVDPASTDDTPASAASASTLSAVQVDGHYNNGVGTSNAASQGVIMGALLQDIPILRPGEVLEAIPGLVVTQHSGEGKANQYFLRGYNLDHGTDFTSAVDGVPVNMPTNGHGQGYSDINFLIPELVDHIDYRKGPYFAQNGDFSSAGSADVVYRNTLPAPLLNLTIGSDGYKRGLFAGSFPLSGTEKGPVLLTALEAMKEDGPWQHPDDMHKLNGVLRLSDGDAQQGWSADALVYAAHWNSTDQVPLSLIQSGELCRFCALDPTDGGRTAREILSGEFHQSNDAGYLRVSGFAEHYRLQLWSNFTYFEDDPVHGDQFNQRDARNIFGTRIAKGWTHTLFGKDSVTEVGAQLRHDQIHVSLLDSQARVAFHTVSSDLVGETEGGLYVENTTTWSNWFRSLVGLRGDAIDINLRSNVYAPNNGSVSDNRISPKLALIFGPWDKTEFFFNIGNGFHSNDGRGVVNQFDATSGMPITRAPALVGSFGKEIGARTEIIPGLQSSLALWSLNSSSELVYGADSGGTEINGASKRYGVEWNNHMAINQWLLLDADLAWTHARYAHENENDDIGDQIPNAVSKVASIGLTAHHVGPWTADIKMLYIGGYPLSQDGNLRAPSSLVTNLRVQREINPHVSLSLDVLNIFDRKYYDIAYEQDYQVLPTSPLVPDGVTVHPGEPREVRLTVSLKM